MKSRTLASRTLRGLHIMSKRSLASTSTPSTPKEKKKPKVSADQQSLDTFFGVSPQRANADSKDVVSPHKGKRKVKAKNNSDVALDSSSDLHGGNQSYAVLLVERGKVELQETERKRAQPEIIDVDSLEDEVEAGLSNSLRVASPVKSNSKALALSEPIDTRNRSRIPSDIKNDSAKPPVYKPLDVDPPTFNVNFDFPQPTPIPYSFLAHALSTLTSTRSRIAILDTLTNTLRVISQTHPASLLAALYLLSNTLSPPYEPVELGLGHSIISKAIQHVSGLTPAALKRLYNKTGDPGDVAFEAKSNVGTLIPHPPLLITAVYDSLLKIAAAKGQGAGKQKQAIVEKLLVAAKGEEVRFLVRTLCQNLRVGAVRTSILTSLARAMVLTPPANIAAAISADSTYHARPELVASVKAQPVGPSAKKKKKSEEADEAREQLTEKYVIAEALVKRVFVQHPNYDHIAAALLEAGLDGLANLVPLTVGVPLHPTLGSPTRSLDEIYDRLENLPFAAEFKYDGQRAQIHAWKHGPDDHVSVRIFSRHLEDMTDKYPDIIQLVNDIFVSASNLHSFIIDAEIVAIDPTNGNLKSFQELSNRARKDVQVTDIKVAVCVFVFDLMYLNGEILLGEPFRKRRALLRANLPPVNPEQKGAARLDHVQSIESEDGREVVEEFWQKALDSRVEGLMIKLLDSGEILQEPNSKKDKPRRKPLPATYEPDKRTSAWLKLKKDYVTGLGDSLDLVPIGAWHGNGRKAQWWSPILLALRDPESGELVAICKCMSGFSDVFYKALKERYAEESETCSRQQRWACETGGLKPEVYFKPQEVWEIRGADVTLSPVSVAALGIVSQSRGLSLRFPRFIRIREDKAIEEASSPEFLAQIYRSQQGKEHERTGMDDDELMDVSMGSEMGESEDELST